MSAKPGPAVVGEGPVCGTGALIVAAEALTRGDLFGSAGTAGGTSLEVVVADATDAAAEFFRLRPPSLIETVSIVLSDG